MSPDWLSALSALATFVVVLGSAIAALIQLRHMRGGNQITIVMGLREALDLPEFQAAVRFVTTELAARLTNPDDAREIANMPPFIGEYTAIRDVANFWEGVGAFAKTGLVDKVLLCDIFGYMLLMHWHALAPVITSARVRTGQPGLWENFEYGAMLVTRYEARSAVAYPKNFPRMPVDTSLADRVAQRETP